MKSRPVASALLLLCALVAAASGGDDAATIVYRLDCADGKPPAAQEVKNAVDVLAKRFNAAGLTGIEVEPSTTAGQLTVRLPKPLVARAESISELAERPGTLAFRIVSQREAELKHMEEIDALGARQKAPSDCEWVPEADGASRGARLVEVPEKPLRMEVGALHAKGAAEDSAEYKAVVARYEQAVRECVFTGDQIARAQVQRQHGEVVVYFEFNAERKPYFAAFTKKNVNREMAMIVDGKVASAPTIRSELPGEGIIESGHGLFGFTDEEAKEFVAVLSAGSFGGRLIRVSAAASSHVLAFKVDTLAPGSGTPCFAVVAEMTKNPADILAKRCAHVGLDGVTTSIREDGDVVARVPASLADGDAGVRRLAARTGFFELRIRAETTFEDEWRERRLAGAAKPPVGYAWCDPEDGALPILVEVPEADAAAKAESLLAQRVRPSLAEDWHAAELALEKVLASSCFTNADVAAATVERSISTYGAYTRLRVAVRFELKDARKAAFEKFTGDHVGRSLAVVLDGKVHLCLPIKSAIPGEGRWIGPGTGYTDESAQETAALLACDPLPCRLVPENDK